jgi:hypothetical protein
VEWVNGRVRLNMQGLPGAVPPITAILMKREGVGVAGGWWTDAWNTVANSSLQVRCGASDVVGHGL